MKQKDLLYFKEILLSQKEDILRNLNFSHKEIEELKEIEINDEADIVAVGSGKNIDVAISKRQMQKLQEIEMALKRLAKGNYGICEMCEEKITMQRLKAKPQAKYCIKCREIIEKQKN